MPAKTQKKNDKKVKVKHTPKGKKGGAAMQQQSGGVHPLVGAAVGAAVGGVMGAAAAVALKDKDTREKVKTAASNLKDQAMDKIEVAQDKAQNVADVTKKEAQKQLSGNSQDQKKN